MVEILRYQVFVACLLLFLQFWYTALANIDHIKFYFLDGGSLADNTTIRDNRNNNVVIGIDTVIRYLPLWAIMALGMYALGSVLVRVYNMADRPDAAVEMMNEIDMAKNKLRSAGFVF